MADRIGLADEIERQMKALSLLGGDEFRAGMMKLAGTVYPCTTEIIAALRANTDPSLERVEAMREALSPFAEALDAFGDDTNLDDMTSLGWAIQTGRVTITGVSIGDIRHARDTLAKSSNSPAPQGDAQRMREACLQLVNSTLYGAPSTWPNEFPRGWKPPLSWEPGRIPTPGEAALHDNGVTDAWIAVLTGTRDEHGNACVPIRALPVPNEGAERC